MKKIFVLVLCLLLLALNVSATTTNRGSAYAVIEATTGRLLNHSNENTQFLVASTSKIMTAMVAIEDGDLEEEIVVTKKDVMELGSKVYLCEDEKISKRDLLYALMLRSANDAASALSDNNSNEFITKMNRLAKKIGMKNSVFANASGLDEREYNLSTAYDMALLSAYANQNETFVEIASCHTYQTTTSKMKYTWTNKHKLVTSNENFIWGKTGYTKKSGRILVSNFEELNKKLIVVTINDGNDWNHHKTLVQSVSNYEFVKVFSKGIYDTKLDVTYYLHIKEDIVIPIYKEEKENIRLEFRLLDETARLCIFLDNKFVVQKTVDVYTKKNFDIDLVIDLFF